MGGILKKALPIAGLALGGLGLTGALGGAGGLLGNISTIGKVLSAVNTAQSMFGGGEKQQSAPQEEPVQAAQAPAYTPSRPGELAAPEGLGELAGWSPEQQRSALATRGINAGLGSEEENYYRNLLQRSLIGEGNVVNTENPNFLMPIESQYFSRKGINTSNVMDFLQGLQG